MKKKTFIMILIFLLCLITILHGKRMEELSSIQVSKNWMSQFENVNVESAKLENIEQFMALNIRVISFNEGFVIVSDDDQVKPILGYSPNTKITSLSKDSNVMSWLSFYSKQIDHIKTNNLDNEIFEDQWHQLLNDEYNPDRTEDISPLLSTEWGQGQFYNDLCPYDVYSIAGNDHTMVGCVATAMAQCMKYWNYPDSGTGSNSYTHSVYGVLSADFSNTSYNWSNMPDQATEENIDLATIMYHSGVSVNMGYGPSESATSDPFAEIALRDYFNYDTNLDLVYKSNYSDTEWENLLKSELESGHPLYYRGQDATLGHAFVCDGYQNSDYFHFNWGWDGNYNGYFYLDYLTPIPGNSYTDLQSAIIGLVPSNLQETFEIIVNNDSGETGSTIEVSIETNSLSSSWNLTDYDLELAYDTSILSYDSYITENTISEECTISITETEPGVLTVNANSVEALSGSGNLFKLVFLAESPGVAEIGINSFHYNIYEVNDLVNGEVVVVSYDLPVGDGSEEDPYQIETIENLLWMSENPQHWDKFFIQTSDIDAAITKHINDGAGFKPVGNDSIHFTGSYDGQFHVIDNLFISLPDTDYVGLFGFIQYGIVKNLGLENVDIEGKDTTAALVGTMNSSIGTVTNCYSNGIVVGRTTIAGLIGICNSDISNCYSCCDVSSYHVDAYLTAGLVARLNNSIMENSYFAGVLGGPNINGLLGVSTESNITNSFWDIESSGAETSGGGIGLDTAQMQNISTYINAGWDFMNESNNGDEDIWGINPEVNNGYPFLSWEGYEQPNQAPSLLNPINDYFLARNFDDFMINLNDYFSDFENDEMNFSYETNNGGVLISISDSLMQISSVDDFSGEVEVTVSVQSLEGTNERIIQNDTFIIQIYSEPMAGDGSDANPYQISCFEHLCWLSEDKSLWDKNFIQISDIDASESQSINDGLGAIPIGNTLDKFTGSYDGQDYTISDLVINRPDTDYVGLFGYIDSASISNIQLVNASIMCHDYSGSLIGKCSYSSITNCSSSAIISGWTVVGGLIGYNSNSTMDLCSNSGTLTGYKHLGGLVSINDGTVSDCYSSVDVTASVCHAGGLVEGNVFGASVINSFSTGNVEGTYAVGGLIGSNSGAIINSYYNYESVLINDENQLSEGALNDEMYNLWLTNNKILDINEYLDFNGSEYAINNVADFKQLLAFGQGDNSFILMNDIDLSEENNFYIPYFEGFLDGNAHKIENIDLNQDSVFGIGLFGMVYEAEIKNLEITNVNLLGKGDVGAIAGKVYNSTLDKCNSTGVIDGTYRNGGLVGTSYYNSDISNCFSSCSVSGQEAIGGLIGKLGTNSQDDFSIVSNCYSIGEITEEAEKHGGLVGAISSINNSDVTNSFWDIETSGVDVSNGGTGLTTMEMQNIQTYLDAGWDFYNEIENGAEEVWEISPDSNDGYPYFNWLPVNIFAVFSASDTVVYTGEEIQFIDASTGNPTSWSWDFDNDGTIDSNEQNPIWSYDTAGSYSVSLTVSDGLRNSTTISSSKNKRNRMSNTETKIDYITVDTALPEISLSQNSLHFDIDKDINTEQTQLLTISNMGDIPLEIELSSNITVTDYEGNVYQTVTLGNQLWTAENLRTIHYNDGSAIPNITDNSQWANLETDAYCAYNNDENNAETYGYLYNWHAINTGSLAPEGWHVPTDEEIMQLEMFLGMSENEASAIGWSGTNQGSQLAGNGDLWVDSELENDQEFGITHFDILPGGRRLSNGTCVNLNHSSSFWSSSEIYSSFAWQRKFFYNETRIYKSYESKKVGSSVRFVRDIANLTYGDYEERSGNTKAQNPYKINSSISKSRDTLNTWLSYTPTTITLTSGASINIEVTVNADTLSNGEYSGGIYIASNDYENDLLYLPVTMSVSGNLQPVIDFAELVVEFNEDNQSEIIDLSTYVSDPDNDLDELTLSAINSEHIVADLDGFNVTFTATEDWSGSEEITFIVDDNFVEGRNKTSTRKSKIKNTFKDSSYQNRETSEAQLTVTVLMVNDAPVLDFGDLDVSFEEDTALNDVDFSPYLSDVDNTLEELTLSAINSEHISVIIDSFDVSFTADENWFGSESIIFTLDDNVSRINLNSPRLMSKVASSSRLVVESELEVTVTPVNDAPTIDLPETFTFAEDSELIEDFYNYIDDVDLDNLSLEVSGESNIIIDISDLTVTFTSIENWYGTENLTFTVNDNQGRAIATDDVAVTVTLVNDPPYVVDEIADLTVDEDFETVVTINLNEHFGDIDGDALTYSFESNEDEISIVLEESELTLSSVLNWYGTSEIIVTADDNQTRNSRSSIRSRATVSDTFSVVVNPINDEPIIISYLPEELEFEIIEVSEQEVDFSVQLEDVDSDLAYTWFIDDEDMENNAANFTYTFTENGAYEVKSIVSDEEYDIETVWIVTVSVTSIDEDLTPLYETSLTGIYPNPFNPSTSISFSLAKESHIEIEIYNLKGQKIKSLLNEVRNIGNHSITWEGKDDNNSSVCSGIYLIEMKTDRDVFIEKALLLK